MSLEQLIENKLRNEFSLTEDEISEAVQEEIAKHESRSILEKKSFEKQLRSEVENSVGKDEILKELQTYEQTLKESQMTPEKIQEKFEFYKAQDFNDIDAAAKQLIGADLEGVQLTQDFIDGLKNNYNPERLGNYVAGDKLNATKFIVDEFILANYQKIADAAYERGKKDSLKKVANPEITRSSSPTDTEKIDPLLAAAKAQGVRVPRVINLD